MIKKFASIEDRIADFKASVITNMLDEGDVVDWGQIQANATNQAKAISDIQNYIDRDNISAESLQTLLQENPEVYAVLLDFIAVKSSGSQMEKWGFPIAVPSQRDKRQRLAKQLLFVGIEKLFNAAKDANSMYLMAQIYTDSHRRRFRSSDKLQMLAKAAILRVVDEFDGKIQIKKPELHNSQINRALEWMVWSGGKRVAAIAVVLQSQSGGRQQRDLSVIYPNLQKSVGEYGLSLILLADGPGLADASQRSLTSLFENVHFPMNIYQSTSGALSAAISASLEEPKEASLDKVVIDNLIKKELNSLGVAKANSLPIPETEAKFALARFLEVNTSLNAELIDNGRAIQWANAPVVKKAKAQQKSYDADEGLNIFASLFDFSSPQVDEMDYGSEIVIEGLTGFQYAESLLVASVDADFSTEIARQVSRRALSITPESRVAILITPRDLSESELAIHRQRQSLRPINLLVLGPEFLIKATENKRPWTLLGEEVVSQSDLTKVSPFVLNNATPSRMFFGRDVEAATVLSTIPNSSVALLGSRRIGKTSLLRKLQEELDEANYSPYFLDCQTIKTWEDFSMASQKRWGIELTGEFRPHRTEELIDKLAAKSEGGVVILMDEIDQLLLWDIEQKDDMVPEALFRSFRSISQANRAQFVFSGERSIAEKIWDPESPHWNFCRPINLTQLKKQDIVELVITSLKAMNIEIVDEAKFGNLAWHYTNGHPQIAQYLGDKLVGLLNKRSNRSALILGESEINEVVFTHEYAEHYITTYLGQAREIEKTIALLMANLSENLASYEYLYSKIGASEKETENAIKMLILYGIVAEHSGQIKLRADWFPDAINYFGAI